MTNLNPLPRPFTCSQKADIKYPCSWTYKLIGTDEKSILSAIETVLGKENVIASRSNTSSKGKYLSFNAETVVKDEESRLRHYNNFKNHAAIKVVL